MKLSRPVAWTLATVAVLAAIAISLSALASAYHSGYVAGLAIERNAAYRHQESAIRSAMRQHEFFKSMKFERRGTTAIIIGTATAAEFAVLEREVKRKLGESDARRSLREVEVVD